MFTVYWSSQFKKDLNRLKKQNKDMSKFKTMGDILATGQDLPIQYRDHELVGN